MFSRGCGVFALVSLIACSSSSVPTGPAPAVTSTIRTVTISGTSRLTTPGQTTQLTAIATMSDGSEKDVTTTVPWRSDHSNVATVSQGLVTAVDFGAAGIDVALSGNDKLFEILVLPEGTYILSGQCVQDPDHKCLADARVEIVGGPMSGRTTMTDQGGNWTFIGVSGVLQVRVSKDSYITVVQDLPQLLPCGPVLAPIGFAGAIPAAACI
jgi:hypothetical protein